MHSHTQKGNTKKSTLAKQESVAFESQQEALLMALLAQYGIKFVVSPPRKTCSNCQFIDIHAVVINNVSYNFEEFLDHYIECHVHLSPSNRHYNKYQKRNQTAATNNILIEMLRTIGWKIMCKNSKEAVVTLKMERINVLSFGGVSINGEDIAQFGDILNKELKSVVSHKGDASLMIGNNELPLGKYIDLSSIYNNVDLTKVAKILAPINVSKQIGEGCMNEMNINNYNNYMMNRNEFNRNEVEKYLIECSKAMDYQNQNVSQTVTMTDSYPTSGKTAMNARSPVVPVAADHDDIEKRRDDLKNWRELEEMKYENELPPATNLPQQHQEFQLQNTSFSSNGLTTVSESYVMTGFYQMFNGCIYFVDANTGVMYYCCSALENSTVDMNTNVMSVAQMNQTTTMLNNDNAANALVEGDAAEEDMEDCGFLQMTNYNDAV